MADLSVYLSFIYFTIYPKVCMNNGKSRTSEAKAVCSTVKEI